jgi:succinyl-CoA synthetase beta subunit
MARQKISEFTAKSLLLENYQGFAAPSSVKVADLAAHFGNTNLVVKVDQGIKKRGLQGLVKVNVTASDIPAVINTWSQQGWSSFLIEPVIEHAPDVERYLALERVRTGWQVSFSKVGGVDIESHWDQVQSLTYPETPLPKELSTFITSLLPKLDAHHISFLEMNPVILRGPEVIPLDMACEVDDTGSTLPTIPDKSRSQAEAEVAKLDASTPASLKFKLLNPDGSIWVLLSGGGASLVLADEVADQGMGKELANYGEYSGAPTDDDVYSYTKIIAGQLLSSKRQGKKAIVIAAGIANFTDVAKTFKGIIRALSEVKSELLKAKVKVFVRRGGPNEAKGLKLMGDFLTGAGIPHIIHHHETPLTQVISDVKEYL